MTDKVYEAAVLRVIERADQPLRPVDVAAQLQAPTATPGQRASLIRQVRAAVDRLRERSDIRTMHGRRYTLAEPFSEAGSAYPGPWPNDDLRAAGKRLADRLIEAGRDEDAEQLARLITGIKSSEVE